MLQHDEQNDSDDPLPCRARVPWERNRYAGAVVRKYDPDGNELWTQLEAEDLGAVHRPTAMTLDSRGRVFVVGYGAGGFIWLVPEP